MAELIGSVWCMTPVRPVPAQHSITSCMTCTACDKNQLESIVPCCSYAKLGDAKKWHSVKGFVSQDQEMASPEAQQGLSTFRSGSASQTVPDSSSGSASNAVSEPLGRLSTERTRQALPNILPSAAGPDSTDASRDPVKPSTNAEAGQRGQSQYAQFLRRSSVEAPIAQGEDGQPLRRRSSSLGADHSSAGRALNLERQPSKVHSVPAHQSGDGDSNFADHVQEAASHREQMSGVAGDSQAPPQLQQKSLDRQLTFQEMLRQQIQVNPLLTLPVL